MKTANNNVSRVVSHSMVTGTTKEWPITLSMNLRLLKGVGLENNMDFTVRNRLIAKIYDEILAGVRNENKE